MRIRCTNVAIKFNYTNGHILLSNQKVNPKSTLKKSNCYQRKKCNMLLFGVLIYIVTNAFNDNINAKDMHR